MARLDAPVITLGYSCPMCGVVFLLRSRFEAHREAEIPTFTARQGLKRQLSEVRWRARQIETGRMTADGQWVREWRP